MKPTQLTTLLLLLLLLLASPTSFAKTYGELKFAELKAIAAKGDTTAMIVLADRYEKDKRDKSNKAKALQWYTKAAERGDVGTQAHLARCYYRGSCAKTNKAEATKWAKKAAEQGNANAQLLLAILYLESPNKADHEKATKLVYEKAMQGDADAQMLLAGMYADGKGVKANKAEAIKWMKKSAAQGQKLAKDLLKKLEKPPKKK